jgi:hypothetical protein
VLQREIERRAVFGGDAVDHEQSEREALRRRAARDATTRGVDLQDERAEGGRLIHHVRDAFGAGLCCACIVQLEAVEWVMRAESDEGETGLLARVVRRRSVCGRRRPERVLFKVRARGWRGRA